MSDKESTLMQDYLQQVLNQTPTPKASLGKATSSNDRLKSLIVSQVNGLLTRDSLNELEVRLLSTLMPFVSTILSDPFAEFENTFVEDIVKFNKDRNLTNFDPVNERRMIEKELDEFTLGANDNNPHEMVDGLCDVVVFALGAIHKLGYDPTECMEETLKEVLSRKGELDKSTGKWEKDPNQDPSTLYKAVYTPR